MTNEMARVQEYWNDIAADFDAIYTGRKSALGKALDRFLRKDMFQRFDWVMRKAGDVKGQSICDIGCGSGRFVVAFAKNGASDVAGIDVAPRMLKLAGELAQSADVANRCRFFLADVLNWRSEATFDTTIAIGLWDYIADPRDRLQIIRRMTRGRFLSAWPRFGTWRMPIRKLRLGAAGCPVYFFRQAEVYQMLEQAGFRVASCETLGQLYCVEAIPI